jgi:uncharacterized protein YjiS (DUF1127 family)
MTMTTASTSAPLASRRSFPFITWFRSRLLARWHDRHVQRLDLVLRDLGLTPEDVRRECAKSFWQA